MRELRRRVRDVRRGMRPRVFAGVLLRTGGVRPGVWGVRRGEVRPGVLLRLVGRVRPVVRRRRVLARLLRLIKRVRILRRRLLAVVRPTPQRSRAAAKVLNYMRLSHGRDETCLSAGFWSRPTAKLSLHAHYTSS